jgi:hypothetical protein
MGASYEKQAGKGDAKKQCGETGEKGEKTKIESGSRMGGRKSKVTATLL